MKQNDIITLMVTIFVSIVLSIVAANILFSRASLSNQKVDIVPRISTNFTLPNSLYFNNKSIDPTQIINIAPGNNQQVFSNPTN